MMSSAVHTTPGEGLDEGKMPGHWLLARLGKRVLRPGGLELTKRMLAALNITSSDRVVEFAPGLGVTADLLLASEPAEYVAVERDEVAAAALRKRIGAPSRTIVRSTADRSGLSDGYATVVCGEAVLSMQTDATKRDIAAEAFRILQPGGRFAIHELALVPDAISRALHDRILAELSSSIHIGARPGTASEWHRVLSDAGFVVEESFSAPMHLLRISRLLQDEGLSRTIHFLFSVAKSSVARRRVKEMARIFRRYERNIGALALVARRPVLS